MTTATAASTRALLEDFRAVRAATMHLIAPLSPEDLMVQSSPDASPVKWHLAHSSWFFETFVLRDFLPGYEPFHPDFHWLFNSYYNALGEMPEKKLRASFSRPPLDQILAYRAYVDAAVIRLLKCSDVPDEALRRITLGLHHEQQHQELIATDVKHALFTNPLHPAYLESSASVTQGREAIAPPIEWISFEGGLAEIGINPDPDSPADFAFDNETPRHTVYLAPYSLASRPITCAEYLAFIEDNGYARPELWLSEGWMKMRECAWQSPLYWQRDPRNKSAWSIYTLHGFKPLEDLSETPVCHLSFFEADAYARYAGCRLPTEFEWEHAASSVPVPKPTSSNRKPSIPSQPSISTASSSSSVTPGSGHPRATPAIPATNLFPELSASTTASSCPARSSFVEAPASHPYLISAPPTATSSHPQPAGSSPASASQSEHNHRWIPAVIIKAPTPSS